MATPSVRFVLLSMILAAGIAVVLADDAIRETAAGLRWKQHDNHRPKPPLAEPADDPAARPVSAPTDAMILFDGGSLDRWETPEGKPAGWRVEGGVLEVVPGEGPIQTRDRFGDVQLHVEWAAPDPPGGVGQDRGNSGIFLMGQFELQVLDSYKAETYADGQAGAIYGQYPPLFNAARPPGQWQTYDIAFRRPRFDAGGKLLEPARMTVFLNGILVQNHEELWGQTSWMEPIPYDPQVDRGPIQLQDHSHPVRFRNIWLRKLPERAAPTAKEIDGPAIISLGLDVLNSFAGRYEAGSEANAMRVTIVREDHHLLLQLTHRQTPLRLDAVSPTVFVMPRTDASLTFQKDGQGHVTGLLMRIGDGSRTLKRTMPLKP